MPDKPASDKPKTYTNWNALANAHLHPVTIKCQAYQPFHASDPSCHGRLKLDAATLRRHTESEHSGGFQFILRRSEAGKIHPIWAELIKEGLEAQDFRCAVCDKQIRFHPTAMTEHMKPHRGMTRQSYSVLQRDNPPATTFFNITLGLKRPEVTEDQDEFDNE